MFSVSGGYLLTARKFLEQAIHNGPSTQSWPNMSVSRMQTLCYGRTDNSDCCLDTRPGTEPLTPESSSINNVFLRHWVRVYTSASSTFLQIGSIHGKQWALNVDSLWKNWHLQSSQNMDRFVLSTRTVDSPSLRCSTPHPVHSFYKAAENFSGSVNLADEMLVRDNFKLCW